MSEIESGKQLGRAARAWLRGKSFFLPGTLLYSAGFGAAAGVALAAAALAARVGKVYLWDEEYLRLQSRRRYLEKQTAFFADLQAKLKAHFIANLLVSEYNPVDTRLPFQAISDKFRF